MVLQSSGAISLGNIQTEFGGTNPISISEYYAAAIDVPASGTIALSNFYGGFSISGRGIFAGGLIQQAPDVHTNTLDYITISTSGNATDFGDLSSAVRGLGSCSSTTRALFAGGLQLAPVVSYRSAIQYSTIATTGNATAFGDLTVAGRLNILGCSSPTRGVFAGGFIFPAGAPAGTTLNTIDYVTIATIGNATDFGDLSTLKQFSDNACSSSVRGVFIGGFDTVPATGAYSATYNTIDYITIATTGNTTSFGTISSNHDHGTGACSSPSRGVFGGGGYQALPADAPLQTPGSFYIGPRTAEYLTIATTGNSTNFGNLNTIVEYGASTSNSIRGIFAGGGGYLVSAPTTLLVATNVIDYVTIATTGSGTDFGDLTVARQRFTACSDSDGGIVAAGGGGGGGGGGGSIGPGVGLFGGGLSPANSNTIDYVTIATTGNAADFGDLTVSRYDLASCSSATRGVFGGGFSPSTNVLDYVTLSTTGNSVDFGDSTVSFYRGSGCSSPTRGIFAGGTNGVSDWNVIQYITIATIGNATDFGDLTTERALLSSCSSPTRGLFGGGLDFNITTVNTINYITIATTGNAIDFGDLTVVRTSLAACSSPTRGVFGGGQAAAGAALNTIDYVTIATTGNATDFGDLIATTFVLAACSSPTRGLFGGGVTPANTNAINYITIATTGNAIDFGDLTVVRSSLSACSDSHGGLDGGGGGTSIGPGVGIFGGGTVTPGVSSVTNTIDYITIATTGNATDFGDITVARSGLGACSSPTRGVFGGGAPSFGGYANALDYITMATTGNATDFGDITAQVGAIDSCSSPTRGVFAGGSTVSGEINTIDYITIATTGNATDFGDITVSRAGLGACSSPTRGVFGGGFVQGPVLPTYFGTIDYITLATTGNAISFGNLSITRGSVNACSSPTRGVFGGGDGGAIAAPNTIDYITIATTGNAIDFGDLSTNRLYYAATSSPTRGVFGGGFQNLAGPAGPALTWYATIDYITIATTGNTTSFGGLSQARSSLAACSDSHGGLV